MKRNIDVIIAMVVLMGGALFSQKTELLKTKYFVFQSSQQLNMHLFLYNKAMVCKFKKVHDDSLAYYAFKDKSKGFTPANLRDLNPVIKFYKDSLLNKDLLFDNSMRDFSDQLISEKPVFTKWQLIANDGLKMFEPFFIKQYWPAIETQNKNWVNANKAQIIKLEDSVVTKLEKIYDMKLPDANVIIDLVNYATWTGAYSYRNSFSHVIFSSEHRSNQGDLAGEVVFHETSHFIIDKLEQEIKTVGKGKDIKPIINLWHNMIFYTTGYVLQKYYSKEGKDFVPYYVQMKFEDKFPDFKTGVEACKLYWNDHIEGKTTMQESVKGIVKYMLEKK